MDLQLHGKTAFISGSTKGIDFAIASLLAQEGARVYLNGIHLEEVNQAITILQKRVTNSHIKGITADLATAKGVANVTAQLPTVDILINNLGIYKPGEFAEISDEQWYRMLDVNLMSGIRLTRHYLPLMKQRNWGRVVFISSESGIMIPKEMIHYGVSKTAQISLARGLAETTVGTQVTVNSVLPGPTLTPGVQKFINDLSKEWNIPASEVERRYFEKVRPGSLLQRFTQPEEVVNLVAYVVSPLAQATNGAALRVDGGLVKSIL